VSVRIREEVQEMPRGDSIEFCPTARSHEGTDKGSTAEHAEHAEKGI
jgi:hypothetical protein